MCRQKIKVLVFLFFVFAFCRLSSQIIVTPTVGCVPLTGVTFSGPAGATGITWNFGDAVTSNVASPTHNYTSVGNFIVTYNAIVGGTPTTYTALVVVHGSPTANFTFTAPPVHCKPLTVQFNSTSSGPSAISGYTWNFGDGGQGNSANQSWTYNLQGAFYVTLLVKDNNGCVSALSAQQGPINVSTPPNVVITSNPLSLTSCTAPFTAAFSASNSTSGSPIAGPLTSYSWNFGNAQTSTQQTPPSVTYTTGVYTVSLTVTDNNNCSATAVKPVTVLQPTISAIIPSTVCIGVPFTYTYQTNQTTTNWNFSPTSSTVLITPTLTGINTNTYMYSSSGTKTITITAGSFPCTTVLTKTVYVEQVVASFSFTPPSFTCSPTFTASYTNQSSSNASTYTWTVLQYNNVNTFTSTAVNPTFTLNQGSLNPYTYYYTYGALVTLVAESVHGCYSTDTMHIYDSIRRPTAWFNTDKSEGCVPLTVKFRDSSETNTTVYPITSYTWNNGANPATIVTGFTSPTPPYIPPQVFTYTAVGTYTPFLSIQTASGCVHTSYIHTITVVNPPVINFNVTPTGPVCWNQPITINATSTSTSPLQHWHVSSDDGFFSGCVNNPNPQWNFTHIGVHTFTVDGYLNSCKGTATNAQSITVKGPIVQSRYQTNCNAGTRKVVSFSSQLQDVQNATLNFGDATAPVAISGVPGGISTHNVTHTYTASGDYTATINATSSNGCPPYTYTMLVTVRDIQANFTLPSVGCTTITQTFNASTSVDVHVGCKRGYVWYFDGTPPRDTVSAIITHTFATAGTHSVLLMVKDDNSCVDTTLHIIRISSANPTFAFSSNTICLSSGTVQLLNTTAQTPDPVNNFTWDFGDGTPVLVTTTLTSPIHQYFNSASPSQNYTVVLTGTNSIGCIDVTSHILTIINPQAYLFPSVFNMCISTSTANAPANTATFTAPSAYTSYSFDYGDGSSIYTSTNNVSPAHTYTAAGSYTAGIVVDLGGCRSSGNVVVNVNTYPVPDFTLSTGNIICRDSQVEFTNTSTTTSTPILNWDLSTGSPILPVSPVVWTYTTTGTAVITLTVTTNGCASTISKTISILGASANLNLDKQVVCLGNSLNFNLANASNVFMYTFDYGDGTTGSYTTSAAPNPTVTHTYNYYPLPTGNTTVSLSYYPSGDPNLCPRSSTIAIQIVKIDGNFNRNAELAKKDSVHCIGITDQFTNQTPLSTSYNFNWNFGDGIGTSTTQNPTYTYPLAGPFTVTLNITDPVNGCKGLAIKHMTINPLPVAKTFANDSICQNAPFALTSTTISGTPVFSYTWNPAAGLASPNSASTTATASNSTTYTLNIQDANGCKNFTTKSIYVQLPPANIHWDTTVIIGQVTPLHNNSGSNFTYSWSPATDLSCTNCPYPVSTTTTNITYSVTITDNLGCFRVVNTHTVYIDLKGSVDVPTAFTPNGDGTNDIIYVDGWGIRKLNYFRIFNRWGQLLFESNDIKIGWDGTFNGVPQNMETYVYQVSAITYIGENKETLKTGTFKLIR